MTEWLTTSEHDFQVCIGGLRELFRTGKVKKVKAIGGKRSLNQNDISHVWYQQMAREDRQDDYAGHRRYCKLHHGVPIMREDSDFKASYDLVIKHQPYAVRLQAMDHWPVTSLMNKEQMTRFLEAVRDDYKQQRDVTLEFPSDRGP
ncbi:MAG: hypothetical protein M3Q51_00290 [Pseudomonadota bacterium]|nr:hypothetical protein [Pseudomonadota bacterium]